MKKGKKARGIATFSIGDDDDDDDDVDDDDDDDDVDDVDDVDVDVDDDDVQFWMCSLTSRILPPGLTKIVHTRNAVNQPVESGGIRVCFLSHLGILTKMQQKREKATVLGFASGIWSM